MRSGVEELHRRKFGLTLLCTVVNKNFAKTMKYEAGMLNLYVAIAHFTNLQVCFGKLTIYNVLIYNTQLAHNAITIWQFCNLLIYIGE